MWLDVGVPRQLALGVISSCQKTSPGSLSSVQNPSPTCFIPFCSLAKFLINALVQVKILFIPLKSPMLNYYRVLFFPFPNNLILGLTFKKNQFLRRKNFSFSQPWHLRNNKDEDDLLWNGSKKPSIFFLALFIPQKS